MNTLPDGYRFADITDENRLPYFLALEDIAQNVGIGVNDPETDLLFAVLVDASGATVGGCYGEIRNRDFTFHVAIDLPHQGKGLSHFLVKEALDAFDEYRFETPDLRLSVTVINPRLTPVLYQHGLMVREDISDESAEYAYLMTPTGSTFEALKKAHENDTELFLEAIASSAVIAGTDAADVSRALTDWALSPCGSYPLDLPAEAASALFQAMPLPDCHKEFLQYQYHVSTPGAPKPVHADDTAQIRPSVSAPPEYRRPRP